MDNLYLPRKSQTNILEISMHVCALICIIAYQSIFIFYVGSTVTIKGAIIFLLQVLMYFITVYWVMPALIKERRYRLFTLRLILTVVFFEVSRGIVVFEWLPFSKFFLNLLSREQQIYVSFQVLLVLGPSFLLGFYRQNERSRAEREMALKAYINALAEKQRIETVAYQMQLNPHITFNTLNAIKAQSEEVQPNVAKGAQLLSNILRHSLIDPVYDKKVKLTEELNDLKDHIALHQYLAGNKLHIELIEQNTNEPANLELPPGVLGTLADNVFKYGHLHEPEYVARITVEVIGYTLKLCTFNYKRLGSFHGRGLGLKNVRIILEHYYPSSHALIIEDLEDTFSLTLKIDL